MNKFCGIIIILTLIISSFARQNDEFYEELYIKPLPSGFINTYFQFTTRWKMSWNDNLYNTHLFPRSMAEVLSYYNVRELHVSLTQGIWRYETWGYPVLDAAPGAEVWAWFSSNLSSSTVDEQWKTLCSTLSGVLCSSLNFVDESNSVSPKYSFRPEFSIKQPINASQNNIRYSTLPREIVCTENLTPWKKLLPCSSGLVSLLNSGYVHNTNYHSLGIEIRSLCNSETDLEGCVFELKQTANLVFDPKLLGDKDFSIRKMFGQGLNGACPLAKSSKVYVDITDDKFDIQPLPSNTIFTKRGGAETIFGVFDIQTESPNKMFNIAWKSKEDTKIIPIIPPPSIFAHRFILGHGQEMGHIVTEVTNTYWAPLNVILQENIPWYVPCYMHTLKIQVNGKDIKPNLIYFEPGKAREKPYHLEIAFTIPARSTAKIFYEFDYMFLKWLEYPPDASHGHYLGSSVVSTLLPTAQNYTAIPIEGMLFEDAFNASRSSYFLRVHTESLVLSLPIPDFSMPYNVICLACTVVALAFGPIHSVATKKIVVESKDETKSIFKKLKNKIWKTKSEGETITTEDDQKKNE